MKYIKKAVSTTKQQKDEVYEQTKTIIENVINNKDKALFEYEAKFDNSSLTKLRLNQDDIDNAYNCVDPQLVVDIQYAARNIEAFALQQRATLNEIQDYNVCEGVYLSQKIIPVQACACYVPGGSYPLYSSALMLVIPAKVAGVKRIVACSPIDSKTQMINPATIVAMDIAGANEIYAMGGAQAIAALTYGTESINKVDLIVGPGNQYVTSAKKQCYGDVGIDFIAGPSEVLIISDESGNPDYIAADLLAQSEHDLQASGILITTSEKIALETIKSVEQQLTMYQADDIVNQAWQNNGQVILVDKLQEAYQIANEVAPEHLEIHLQDEQDAIDNLYNYGSLFIGENSAEVFGDYVSGTNHTLPTAQAARYTGGVYVGTFLKVVTQQKILNSAIKSLAPVASRLANNEGLLAHEYASTIRLKGNK